MILGKNNLKDEKEYLKKHDIKQRIAQKQRDISQTFPNRPIHTGLTFGLNTIILLIIITILTIFYNPHFLNCRFLTVIFTSQKKDRCLSFGSLDIIEYLEDGIEPYGVMCDWDPGSILLPV